MPSRPSPRKTGNGGGPTAFNAHLMADRVMPDLDAAVIRIGDGVCSLAGSEPYADLGVLEGAVGFEREQPISPPRSLISRAVFP